ncbi:nicotinate-nucleotide--dimethylbenzimidazole phosphoribosyltransferase [Nisaea sediminum]|uniref:nicotinate-nucleotide--dimethylbenzimidazole phosphoribosyltransferase n=1 Tax=Nisaea sediminum TaxID=2775867 RepID=UPI001867A035|nr:nicotinate-nucleotide--dimethylbenzimidazole phosphoribosyltransferase [Nisaea sediminum]
MSDERFTPESATFDEIRGLFRALPPADLEAGTDAASREAQLTKPAGALGKLEELTRWVAAWQGKHPPSVAHPRICVFAANHGVTAKGVSAYPSDVTHQMVQNFISGGAAVNQLAELFDADLRVYEMALEQPTADFTEAPAMSEDECAKAIAYGMMAVEPGIDLLCLGEMGIGNSTSAAAICHALYGGAAEDWTGPGTGVTGAAYAAKVKAVADGVALHKARTSDPLELFAAVGGLELAAITGAILAARMGRVPVLLDGFACTAAAAVLHAADPRSIEHCQVAHCSAEPGHRLLLEKIGKAPILDLGMRLGEASGAAVAIGIIKAAVACHNGMATFADAGVSGPA